MTPIQYINYETAEAARKMLKIRGPQVDSTCITDKCNIQINWVDGTSSLVTWALFNVLSEK